MKYQDIEVMLRQENVGPNLRKVIQFLHAENAGLKREIVGAARVIDKLIDRLDEVSTMTGLHHKVMSGISEGKSMSDVIAELRAEHLTGVESEETK